MTVAELKELLKDKDGNLVVHMELSDSEFPEIREHWLHFWTARPKRDPRRMA